MPSHAEKVAVVEAYVAAFAASDGAAAAALYAEDCRVEDPVGSPPLLGQTAVLAFYTGAMSTGAKLTLQGPVRTAANFAAFAFSVDLNYGGSDVRIDVIDIFEFNDAGKVTSMRAFWGPENNHVT